MIILVKIILLNSKVEFHGDEDVWKHEAERNYKLTKERLESIYSEILKPKLCNIMIIPKIKIEYIAPFFK